MEHHTWMGSVCPPGSTRPFLRRLAALTRAAHASVARPPHVAPTLPSSAPRQSPQEAAQASPSPSPERPISGLGSGGGEESDDDTSTASSLAYNPLVAQYSEVRGRVGPTSTGEARVLLLGHDAGLVTDFITVLSYFLRSSEVRFQTGGAQPGLPSPKVLADGNLFASVLVPPSHHHPAEARPCCDFTGDVDAVRITADKPEPARRTPPAFSKLFASPFPSQADKPSPEEGPAPDKGERKRVRARSPVEEAMEESAGDAKHTPAVIQVNNHRFEVTTVSEASTSAAALRPRSTSFRRPGSPRKPHRPRPREPIPTTPPQPEPYRLSMSQPESGRESDRPFPVISVPCEDGDDDSVPKLRKVSASYLANYLQTRTPARQDTGIQLSPRIPTGSPGHHSGENGDSSGHESCGEHRAAQRPPSQRHSSSGHQGPPRSLDSGIAEPDGPLHSALRLHATFTGPGAHSGHCPGAELSWDELSAVHVHEDVFGDATELEELALHAEAIGDEPPAPSDGDELTGELYQSLLGGFLPAFSPHFALSGCPPTPHILSVIQEGPSASVQ